MAFLQLALNDVTMISLMKNDYQYIEMKQFLFLKKEEKRDRNICNCLRMPESEMGIHIV